MEHLNHARNCAHDAEAALRENQERLYFGALHDLAALHATIAQAEALTRIAEYLEIWIAMQTPKLPDNVAATDDATDDGTDDGWDAYQAAKRHAVEQLDGLRRTIISD